jgi:hypothetical protein
MNDIIDDYTKENRKDEFQGDNIHSLSRTFSGQFSKNLNENFLKYDISLEYFDKRYTSHLTGCQVLTVFIDFSIVFNVTKSIFYRLKYYVCQIKLPVSQNIYML